VVTSPDDERERTRELDDLSAVPVADRPAVAAPAVERSDGGGDIPTHRPATDPMPRTSEELPEVEGVHMPKDGPGT
jgi:hypothetical protein